MLLMKFINRDDFFLPNIRDRSIPSERVLVFVVAVFCINYLQARLFLIRMDYVDILSVKIISVETNIAKSFFCQGF